MNIAVLGIAAIEECSFMQARMDDSQPLKEPGYALSQIRKYRHRSICTWFDACVYRLPTPSDVSRGDGRSTKRSNVPYSMAIDHGVNYVDTAYPYHLGNSESFLGGHCRTATANSPPGDETAELLITSRGNGSYLDEQLGRLSTDTIEFYLVHSVNRFTGASDEEWPVRFSGCRTEGRRIRICRFFLHDELDSSKRPDAYAWSFSPDAYNFWTRITRPERRLAAWAIAEWESSSWSRKGREAGENIPPAARTVGHAPVRRACRVGVRISGTFRGSASSERMLRGGSSRRERPYRGEAGPNCCRMPKGNLSTGPNRLSQHERVDCTGCRYCLPGPRVDFPVALPCSTTLQCSMMPIPTAFFITPILVPTTRLPIVWSAGNVKRHALSTSLFARR